MTTQEMRTIATQTEMHHPARQALLDAARQIDKSFRLMSEFLCCNNNDCECRKGFGLCNQCKELAKKYMENSNGQET